MKIQYASDLHLEFMYSHSRRPADYLIGRTRIVHNPRGYGDNGERIPDAVPGRVVAIGGRRA